MDLPRINKNKQSEERGLVIVKKIIEDEIGWIFRKEHLENDYGIDGYIDIVQDKKYLTGKSIAVQIKTGKSYFKHSTSFGWTFYGESKHLNYYLNNELPVIIILVDEEQKIAYWSLVDKDLVRKTENNWKLSVPKSNLLSNYKELKEITKGFVDYTKQIENLEKIKLSILNHEIVFIAIDREEIESGDYSGFMKLQKWLISSEKMILENKGKFFISVFGYDEDERELYQISEVREWFKNAVPIFKYWGYFLNMERQGIKYSGMGLIRDFCVKIESQTYIKEKRGFHVEFDHDELMQFWKYIIGWLNEFTETFNIPMKINYEQSMKINQVIFNIPDDVMAEMIKSNPLDEPLHNK